MFSQLKAVVKSLQKAKPKKKTGELCTEIHKRVLETNKIKDYSIAYISLSLPCASSCLAQGLHYNMEFVDMEFRLPKAGFQSTNSVCVCVFTYIQLSLFVLFKYNDAPSFA